MNRLGQFLKRLRIDHNEVLYDMTQRLGVITVPSKTKEVTP